MWPSGYMVGYMGPSRAGRIAGPLRRRSPIDSTQPSAGPSGQGHCDTQTAKVASALESWGAAEAVIALESWGAASALESWGKIGRACRTLSGKWVPVTSLPRTFLLLIFCLLGGLRTGCHPGSHRARSQLSLACAMTWSAIIATPYTGLFNAASCNSRSRFNSGTPVSRNRIMVRLLPEINTLLPIPMLISS